MKFVPYAVLYIIGLSALGGGLIIAGVPILAFILIIGGVALVHTSILVFIGMSADK